VAAPNAHPTVIKAVKEGDLIPAERLAIIVMQRLDEERKSERTAILLDGFPRRLDQAEVVEVKV
jgi:adenylate kinase family enzyme